MKRVVLSLFLLCLAVSLSGLALAEEDPATGTVFDLEQAIAYAEANSPQLKMAKEAMEVAKAQADQARAALWPDLTLQAGVSSHDPSTKINSADTKDSYQTSATLSQPLTRSLFQQHKLAKLAYQSSSLDYQQAKEDLAFNVTRSFLDVCKANEAVAIAQEVKALAEENLNKAKAFFQAGLVVKTDVLRMELDMANARKGLLAAENNRQFAMAALKQAIGYPQEQDLSVSSPAAFPEFHFDGQTPSSLSDRYDWQKVQLGVDMAEIGVQLAKSGYLPTAYLNLNYNATDNTKITVDDGNTTITLGIQWSLNTGQKTAAQVKEAQSSLRRAKASQEAVHQAATTEILQSQLNYTESQRQLEIAKLALEIAEENSRLAEKRYEAGVGTTIEVSDAQVALEEAKYNELSARYNLYLAGIQYEKSLGRYRQEPQDQGSEK